MAHWNKVFSKCYFPSPFFIFKLLWVGVRINSSFSLVSEQKKLITLRLENLGLSFAGNPHGQHIKARRSGSVPPHLAGRHPASTITSEPEFPLVASAPSLWCRLQVPRETIAPQRGLERRKRSPRHSLGIPLFPCQTHDLWGIWKFTTLWGKETKKFKMKLYISKGLLL